MCSQCDKHFFYYNSTIGRCLKCPPGFVPANGTSCRQRVRQQYMPAYLITTCAPITLLIISPNIVKLLHMCILGRRNKLKWKWRFQQIDFVCFCINFVGCIAGCSAWMLRLVPIPSLCVLAWTVPGFVQCMLCSVGGKKLLAVHAFYNGRCQSLLPSKEVPRTCGDAIFIDCGCNYDSGNYDHSVVLAFHAGKFLHFGVNDKWVPSDNLIIIYRIRTCRTGLKATTVRCTCRSAPRICAALVRCCWPLPLHLRSLDCWYTLSCIVCCIGSIREPTPSLLISMSGRSSKVSWRVFRYANLF